MPLGHWVLERAGTSGAALRGRRRRIALAVNSRRASWPTRLPVPRRDIWSAPGCRGRVRWRSPRPRCPTTRGAGRSAGELRTGRAHRARRLRHRLLVAQLPAAVPVDALKIDRSFVAGWAPQSRDAAIVRAILRWRGAGPRGRRRGRRDREQPRSCTSSAAARPRATCSPIRRRGRHRAADAQGGQHQRRKYLPHPELDGHQASFKYGTRGRRRQGARARRDPRGPRRGLRRALPLQAQVIGPALAHPPDEWGARPPGRRHARSTWPPLSPSARLRWCSTPCAACPGSGAARSCWRPSRASSTCSGCG